MKKLTLSKKLSLSRETVCLLDRKDQLEAVVGGVTIFRCTLTGCGNSGCANTCLC